MGDNMQSNPAYRLDPQGIVLSETAFGFRRDVGGLLRQTAKRLIAFCSSLANRKSHRLVASLVAFGIILTIVGFIGEVFSKSVQQEIGFREAIKIGQYRVVSQSFTQDNLGEFVSEYVVLDVYRGDDAKKITQLFPGKRFYPEDKRFADVPVNKLTLQDDLSVSYVGVNPKSGNPIIKITVKPLAAWKWAGVCIALLGILCILVLASASLARRRA